MDFRRSVDVVELPVLSVLSSGAGGYDAMANMEAESLGILPAGSRDFDCGRAARAAADQSTVYVNSAFFSDS